VLLALSFSLLIGGGRAGAQSTLSASLTDVDDSGPTVRAVLTVDRAGRPVAGLSADAVTIRDNGIEVSVTALDAAIDRDIPLALVLVIDTSGSMDADLARVQAAARGLIERLAEGDTAAVIAFATSVEPLQELTTDRDALFAAVDALVASGDTALYDAVSTAAELAGASGLRRRAVVLLTDGEDFGEVSVNAREESLAAAAGSAAFYTIGVGSNVDGDYLTALAERSGGRFFPAVGGDEIGDLYSTIEGLLRSQYIVTYQQPDHTRGESRSLVATVTVEGELVEARTTYISTAPATAVTAASTAVAAATAVPAAVNAPAAAQPSDGGGSGQALALLGLAVVLSAGGAGLLWRVRRDEPQPERSPATFDERPIVRPQARHSGEPASHASGELVLELDGGAESAALGPAPLSVGYDVTCGLALPEAPGVAPLHARVWTRDGRVMLHHLGNGNATRVNGRSVEWAVLNDGDQVLIGPHVIRYLAGAAAATQAEEGTN